MKIIKAKPGDFIVAGQQGEELARRVEFDIAEWERLYGPGTVQLLVNRMTDETFYPVAIEQEQGVAIWTVTVPETSVAGKYHTYELRYYAGETLAKAVGGRFSINEAFVGEEGEVPEVHQGWVDQIIATGAESLAAQIAAEAARDGAIEAQLNANLANTEAQTAKKEAANYAESALKAENEVSSQAKRAETAANAAEESEKNAKSSEDAAVKAAEVAENSERNAIEAARQAELSKNGIVQAETNASQYAAAAAKSAADASAYKSNAQTFMRGAETARGQAQTSAQAASNFSGRAEESAETAKTNAEAAKAAADSVAGSEQRAEQFAIRAEDARNSIVDSEKNTKADAESADKSAFDAKFYADNAQTANVAASGHAIDAGVSRTNAQIAANSATDSANFASSMATKAEKAAKKAEEAASRAGGVQSVNGITPDENGNVEIVAGVQSDWSQNDPAALDYVKNRTHYETKEAVEILPECQPTYIEDDGFFQTDHVTIVPTAGATCVVNWNGMKYDCVAQDLSAMMPGAIILGNGSMWGLPNTDEPFAVCVVEQDGTKVCMALPLDGTTELTLSICQEQTTVVPIAGKFLPEGMGYIEEGGSATDTLTFDGNIEGRDALEIDSGMYLVHISDTYVESSALVGGTLTTVGLDDGFPNGTNTLAEDAFIDMSGTLGVQGYVVGELVYVLSEDVTQEGITLHKGISVMCAPGAGYVSELKAPTAVFGGNVTIHKLDNRCLDLAWLPITECPLLIEETTVNTGTELDDRRLSGFGTADFPVGTNVVVSVDGVHYPVTVIGVGSGAEGLIFAGNLAILDAGNPDTGEPFVAMLADDRAWFYFKDSVSHKVAVYGEPAPNKLPAEFLPDEAVQNGDTELYLTSSGGKKFKITVSDDGALSAAEV